MSCIFGTSEKKNQRGKQGDALAKVSELRRSSASEMENNRGRDLYFCVVSFYIPAAVFILHQLVFH